MEDGEPTTLTEQTLQPRDIRVRTLLSRHRMILYGVSVCCVILFTVAVVAVLQPRYKRRHESVNNRTGSQQQLEALVTWAIRSGAKLNGVAGRSAFAGGGRGLYALRDLNKGDSILSIPAILWLSERNAHIASAVGHILAKHPTAIEFDAIADEGWSVVLMMQHERANPSSFWAPYLEYLPVPASPICSMSDRELHSMQSDTIVSKVHENRKYIANVYDQLMPAMFADYPNMFDPRINTLDGFIADTVTAWTRSFDVSQGDEGVQTGLVPIADLVNHVPGTPTGNWHLDNNPHPYSPCLTKDALSFEFHAPQPRQANEEIVMSYGDNRATLSWLLWAGFIPSESTYGDYITLRVNSTTLEQWNQTELNPLHEALNTWVATDGQVCDTFLEAYRSLLGRDDNPSWEITLDSLLSAVTRGVTSLPTSLQDDQLVLDKLEQQHPNTDFNLHVIFLMRVRFKAILERLQESLGFRLSHFRVSGELAWPSKQDRSLVHRELKKKRIWSPEESNSFSLYTLEIPVPISTNHKN